jgi:3-phenylpropionate/trans-cinnamate dioxygenase ferredoxin subunit
VTFTPTLTLGDLPPGSARKVVVDGHEVALVHTEGTVFAVGDQCSHADVSLSEGEVDGCTLACWLHGSRFDLRTGRPTGLPPSPSLSTPSRSRAPAMPPSSSSTCPEGAPP